MNIFMHELKAYRKSTIVWTLALLSLMVLFMAIFPTISKEADEFKRVLEGFPMGVQQALGIQVDSFASIIGYYSYVFMYISLCGAIQAMTVGTAIISKETREKTADFLLTKPIQRSTILMAKISAAAVSLLLTSMVFLGGARIIVASVTTNQFSIRTFLLLTISLFFIQLIFLAIGILVSVCFSKIKSVLMISLGTVFTFYIIGILTSSSEDEIKRFLSPFTYFEPNYIVANTSYEIPFLLVGSGIVVIAILSSFFIYMKKDIHSV
ncbi:ABC transporter permease subunit [Fredinandcohnia humi]